MEFNRRHTASLLLLLLAVAALPGLNLECTNDYDETMFCQMVRPNCTEYDLRLRDNLDQRTTSCTFQQCGSGRCCCSVRVMLIYGNTHTASVWRGGQSLGSKIISVIKSVKPKTPKILSVEELNGKIGLTWDTDYINTYETYLQSLTAEVTYYVKGSTEKETKLVQQAVVNGKNYYEISALHLKPSTMYVFSMRSSTTWSKKFSDRSIEWEFKTASRSSLTSVIIVTLSVAAVVLTGAIYGCYVKVKSKWWDSIPKYSNSNLRIFPSTKPEMFQVLKPAPPIISSICVEPLLPDDSKQWSKMSLTDTSGGSFQQSSGISTGCSLISYANTERLDIKACVMDALCKDIPGISPISPLTTSPLAELNKDSGLISSPISLCGGRVDGMSSGSSFFDNITYALTVPQQIMADNSEVQMRAEIPCDSAYHPSESNTVNCPDQQVPGCLLPWPQGLILPPVTSALVPTDMSYQLCNADSGSFSNAEDSSLCSSATCNDTTAPCDVLSGVKAGPESSGEAFRDAMKLNDKSQEATICSTNPCSSIVVEDGYQAFPNLMGQPDVLISEQRRADQEESSTSVPQSFSSAVVPGFTNNAQCGQRLSELQMPFFPQCVPIITESGYQSV
ncbi:uncharacterized protein LOC103362509 isoform X2 [Stegastes partitus]|uniref:Uncharacterized protein LOC103362509 isoform X2 n=1 Tax=Stegastes partitus TaxID=144197 RepID=A0A9Y4K378_9TELE|nr:PREDICTED: uncharacterized protein LOC103362509 isoform X2 [Stegastes partitus]